MRVHLPTLEYPPDFGGVATWTDAVAAALREAGLSLAAMKEPVDPKTGKPASVIFVSTAS